MTPGQTTQLCGPTLVVAARMSATDDSQIRQLLWPLAKNSRETGNNIIFSQKVQDSKTLYHFQIAKCQHFRKKSLKVF